MYSGYRTVVAARERERKLLPTSGRKGQSRADPQMLGKACKSQVLSSFRTAGQNLKLQSELGNSVNVLIAVAQPDLVVLHFFCDVTRLFSSFGRSLIRQVCFLICCLGSQHSMTVCCCVFLGLLIKLTATQNRSDCGSSEKDLIVRRRML